MRLFYFDVWLKGMVGKDEVGEDETRANVARAGCKRNKGCEGRAMAAVTPNKNELQWGLVADT
jgi:hypothetical protein